MKTLGDVYKPEFAETFIETSQSLTKKRQSFSCPDKT